MFQKNPSTYMLRYDVGVRDSSSFPDVVGGYLRRAREDDLIIKG
jgi:hypothetical protein